MEKIYKPLADSLADRYGEAMTTTDLAKVIGFARRDLAQLWAQDNGIRPVRVGRRKKWLAHEIARALENAKEVG